MFSSVITQIRREEIVIYAPGGYKVLMDKLASCLRSFWGKYFVQNRPNLIQKLWGWRPPHNKIKQQQDILTLRHFIPTILGVNPWLSLQALYKKTHWWYFASKIMGSDPRSSPHGLKPPSSSKNNNSLAIHYFRIMGADPWPSFHKQTSFPSRKLNNEILFQKALELTPSLSSINKLLHLLV